MGAEGIHIGKYHFLYLPQLGVQAVEKVRIESASADLKFLHEVSWRISVLGYKRVAPLRE